MSRHHGERQNHIKNLYDWFRTLLREVYEHDLCRCIYPRLTRTEIINRLIAKHGFQTYLEIGFGRGRNFKKICCEKKWSVDPHAPASFQLTSDDFFKLNKDKFDLIFIDGLHSSDTVMRDIENSLLCLNEAGVIVIHDLNPMTESMQLPTRTQRVWSGDGWKAWLQFRAKYPYKAYVVNCDYGVGIIHTKDVGEQFILPENITYQNFNRNRKHWLNLISPKQWRSEY